MLFCICFRCTAYWLATRFEVFCYDNPWKLMHHPYDLSSNVVFWRSGPDPSAAWSTSSCCMVPYHLTFPSQHSLHSELLPSLSFLLGCKLSEGRWDVSRAHHCIPGNQGCYLLLTSLFSKYLLKKAMNNLSSLF